MNIQGITTTGGKAPQYCQIQPGREKTVEKAAEENQLDEVIVKNEQGSYLIYGQELELAYEYANQDGVAFRTLPTGFIGAPQKGERIVLGDLKGDVAYFEDQTNRLAMAGKIGTWGGAAGGAILGAASVHSSQSAMSGLLGGTLGYLFGGMIAMGVTYVVAKPDLTDTSLIQNCVPATVLPPGALATQGLVKSAL